MNIIEGGESPTMKKGRRMHTKKDSDSSNDEYYEAENAGALRLKAEIEELKKRKNFALTEKDKQRLEECVLLDCIQSREFNEDYFDVSLSGTTATIVIQLPDKLIVGWVGNSQMTEHYIDIRKK